MRIALDPNKCSGHGRCYILARQLLRDDERGYGIVIGDGQVPPELFEVARKAVVACPERAVVLLE